MVLRFAFILETSLSKPTSHRDFSRSFGWLFLLTERLSYDESVTLPIPQAAPWNVSKAQTPLLAPNPA